MIRNKKILITGGGGFIGTALAERLVDNNEVTLLDTSFKRNAFGFSRLNDHKNIKLAEIDILNSAEVSKITKGAQIIVHLAAKLGVQHVLHNSSETLNVNYIGTLNVLNAVSQYSSCERFIFLSTSEVFGSNAYKVIENGDSILNSLESTRWCYSLSKLAAEHLAFSYYRERKLPVVVIRPFNVFGPKRVGDNVTQRFILNALMNKNLVVYGDGTQIRAWCYIDDFCEAVITSLEAKRAIGEAFNIGNARNTITAYNLAKMIILLCKSKAGLIYEKIDFKDIDIRVPNISKANDILEFDPKIELDTGLIKTIQWYKNNFKKITEQVKN